MKNSHRLQPVHFSGLVFSIGLFGVITLALLDYWSGHELSFSIFYLGPVLYVTWRTGRFPGICLALVAAGVWCVADLASGGSYSTPLIPVWNTAVRFGFFLVSLTLLNHIRKTNGVLSDFAFTDSLTGAANSRAFYMELEQEIERLRRYKKPFTLAYADLDQFKSVNDLLGHAAGDELLKEVSQKLGEMLREVDTLARLGGDEFALLLPETDEPAAAYALERVSKAAQETIQNSAKDVPGVGITVGALVFHAPPDSIDAAIQAADRSMYEGKKAGRGVVRISRFQGTEPTRPVAMTG